MTSESSDEVLNVLSRVGNLRLGSNEAEESQNVETELGEASSESPQNMQSLGNVTFSRVRRALPYSCDEDLPSTSQARVRDSSSSSSDNTSSNSANSPQQEARPASRIVAENAPGHHAPSRATYNWQGNKATMRERFAFLFNNQILSDVSFLVGSGAQQQRIPAHKLVLSSGSAVFDAMFNGTLATSSAEIEVPDVEPAAFLAVLLFLYTDEIQIDPETVMTTLYTAKKYAVSPLEKHCVDFLRTNLTSDNAFLLLTQARLFDEPQLAAVCLDTIDKFTTDALNADGFTDIDIDTLMAVLERDTLRVRESKIFQAVVRWSKAECARQQLPVTPENQRAVLGRALSLVRFPLMSVEEFATGPAQSGLLPDREIVLLFIYFTVNPKPVASFDVMPRCCMMGKEQTVCRFMQTDKKWGYTGTSDRIRVFLHICNTGLVSTVVYSLLVTASTVAIMVQLLIPFL
ncbi:BTB/POZ domain-containing protein 2 isoform X2 [Cephus cinctus]|uniref:BTB/POZ domain-containing protein 2 isoform X2 n=1 Tax=Cephus cinctus TaxID=211228 RepID=A0AAJ7BWZ1_CEPCN|nr:BTB/POZ domain-containing protein 2 isoform X2 [Cephus cinctus]